MVKQNVCTYVKSHTVCAPWRHLREEEQDFSCQGPPAEGRCTAMLSDFTGLKMYNVATLERSLGGNSSLAVILLGWGGAGRSQIGFWALEMALFVAHEKEGQKCVSSSRKNGKIKEGRSQLFRLPHLDSLPRAQVEAAFRPLSLAEWHSQLHLRLQQQLRLQNQGHMMYVTLISFLYVSVVSSRVSVLWIQFSSSQKIVILYVFKEDFTAKWKYPSVPHNSQSASFCPLEF